MDRFPIHRRLPVAAVNEPDVPFPECQLQRADASYAGVPPNAEVPAQARESSQTWVSQMYRALQP
jgi:hypothetical protein